MNHEGQGPSYMTLTYKFVIQLFTLKLLYRDSRLPSSISSAGSTQKQIRKESKQGVIRGNIGKVCQVSWFFKL